MHLNILSVEENNLLEVVLLFIATTFQTES
jgi:hypothetical protein